MERTAVVVGASGLVGGHLLHLLLEDSEFHRVLVLARRELPVRHYKLEMKIIDFGKMENALSGRRVHDVFCALGSTLRLAGSRSAFRKVDFEYPLRTAAVALKAGAKRFHIVSSIGANAGSANFYFRTKGKLEKALSFQGFDGLTIFRPSVLVGRQTEFRLREKVAIAAMKAVSPLMIGKFSRYKPIEATAVARAMAEIAKQNLRGVHILESNEIAEFLRTGRVE